MIFYLKYDASTSSAVFIHLIQLTSNICGKKKERKKELNTYIQESRPIQSEIDRLLNNKEYYSISS